MKRNTILFLTTCFCFVFEFRVPGQGTLECIIDLHKTYQTISNFGASDCWSAQYIGNWPDKKKNAIADLLFSQEMDSSGQPKGIGLSLWRFNIGAGSSEQGTESNIQTSWRRTECLLNTDGSYNWNKQSGQQWFLKAARERGVSDFLAFTNSPPVYFTANGLANNKGRSATFNLKSEYAANYVAFLTRVLKGIHEKTGVRINYISPFNEPEWNWEDNTQEGTPALSSEISSFVRKLDSCLTISNLDTKILVSESGKLDYVYRKNTDKPGRDNQVETFFNPGSLWYIGDLPHLEHSIAAHSYWTDTPLPALYKTRKELRGSLDKYHLGYWETEYCIMGSDPELGGGEQRDLTMKTALYVARVIHHDLTVGNASAWQWWLGVTYSNYKDGLIYTHVLDDKTDGTFTDSKLLWSLGNYSRFVRPGAVRVDVQSGANMNDSQGMMISSYLNPGSRQLATVIVNYGDKACKVRFKVKGGKAKYFTPYVTSDAKGDNLAPGNSFPAGASIDIPPKSVVTLVGKI